MPGGARTKALWQNTHSISGNPRRCPPCWHWQCPRLCLSLLSSGLPTHCPSHLSPPLSSGSEGTTQLPAANTKHPPQPVPQGSRKTRQERVATPGSMGTYL